MALKSIGFDIENRKGLTAAELETRSPLWRFHVQGDGADDIDRALEMLIRYKRLFFPESDTRGHTFTREEARVFRKAIHTELENYIKDRES